MLKTLDQLNLVALGAKAGQVSWLVATERIEVPRLQFVQPLFRYGLGCRDQHIVEIFRNAARRRIPSRMLHLTCACDLVAAAVAFRVAFSCVIVFPACTGVRTRRMAVVRPEGKIHSVDSLWPGQPLQRARSEPARAKPLL